MLMDDLCDTNPRIRLMLSFGVDGITDVAPKSSQQCVPIAEGDSSKQCTTCKQPRASGGKKKKKFCAGHQQTWKSMLKAAENGRGKGTLENYRDEEHAHTLAVVEHDFQHPSLGLGKPRGKFDHARHARVWTSITYTDEHTRTRKMDLVEFSPKMESLQNARQNGTSLKAKSLIDRDDAGADSAFRLRLNIIIAEEATIGHRSEEEDSLSFFFTKRMKTASPVERRLRCGHQLDERHNSAAK